MLRVEDVPTFCKLLERVLQRATDDDARSAWSQIVELGPATFEARLASALRADDSREVAASFLYGLGTYFPNETTKVLDDLAREGDLLAWRLLAAQLGRTDVCSGGARLSPFDPIATATPLVVRPAAVASDAAKVLTELLSMVDTQSLVAVLDVIIEETTFAVLAFLVERLDNRELSWLDQLAIATRMRALAERITLQKDDDIDDLARRLEALLVDTTRHPKVRAELACLVQIIPVPSGVAILRGMIDNIESTRIGRAYLPLLRRALEASLTRGTRESEIPLDHPTLPDDELVTILLSWSQQPSAAGGAEPADGAVVTLLDRKNYVVRYTPEIISACAQILPSLANHDSAWGDRYQSRLIAAIRRSGAAATTLRAFAEIAQGYAEAGMAGRLPPLLETARQDIEQMSAGVWLDDMHRLSGYAHIAASRTDRETAQAIYRALLPLVTGRDPEIEGGTALSLGIELSRVNDLDGAEPLLQRASCLLERAGDVANAATALMELGVVEMCKKQFDLAREHLEKARTSYESVETPDSSTGLPHCLANIVELELRTGSTDVKRLEPIIARALESAQRRKLGDLETTLLAQRRSLHARPTLSRPKWRFG